MYIMYIYMYAYIYICGTGIYVYRHSSEVAVRSLSFTKYAYIYVYVYTYYRNDKTEVIHSQVIKEKEQKRNCSKQIVQRNTPICNFPSKETNIKQSPKNSWRHLYRHPRRFPSVSQHKPLKSSAAIAYG